MPNSHLRLALLSTAIFELLNPLATYAASMEERLGHSYEEARLEFQLQSEKLKGQKGIKIIQHKLSNADGTLTIDSLYLPPTSGNRRNLVVLISGQHGVEAPAGSAIQRDLLESCKVGLDRSNTGLLFIHGMNPFGFKHGRRFNESNVDLNRNAFDFQSQNGDQFPGHQFRNELYEKLKHLLSEPMYYFHELTRGVEALIRTYAGGGTYMDILDAIGAQYQDPKGVYYGGAKVEEETEIVQKLLLEFLPAYKNVLSLNFHTGLGAYGINNLMTTAPGAGEESLKPAFNREMAVLKELFPEESCEGHCKFYLETSSDKEHFALKGTLTQWIYRRFENERRNGLLIPVVAEIGTYLPPVMLPKVVNENYCYVNPKQCAGYLKQRRTGRLREAFNPDSKDWKAAVGKISQGVCKAIGAFSSR